MMDSVSTFNPRIACQKAGRFPTRGPIVLLALLLMLLTGHPAKAAPSPEAKVTVVIYNAADIESVNLAKHYANRRQIPQDQLIGLTTAMTEEISREEYSRTIAAPMRAALISRDFWKEDAASGRIVETKVRYVAIIRGIPLKIRPDEGVMPNRTQPDSIGTRNEASVDSELMTLGLPATTTAGIRENPYFRRFTPVMDLAEAPEIFLVGRLDAPDAITVRAMIDDAISIERDGLWGWGYIDSRGIMSGPYSEGDKWLNGALDDMRKQGIPVLMDSSAETLPAGFPITDAAVYYGWYAGDVNGPFADIFFRFRPGAVAVHIHSFSAATLRSITQGWCGPLLVRGAAATLGNVYEPYLSLTTDLQIFQDRLMAGFTLAESGWTATQGISWMNVVVGDPLYKPYASWRLSGRVSPPNPSSWELYRRIIRVNDGNVLTASEKLRSAAKRTGNSLFLEALGAAQLDAGQKEESLQTIKEALTIEKRIDVRFRLGLEEYAILRSTGDTMAATRTLSRMANEEVPAKSRELLAAFYEHMVPNPGPTPKMR
ncbi:MAG: TIGR03790 family protein [Terrimicrobiaceae bacterium]